MSYLRELACTIERKSRDLPGRSHTAMRGSKVNVWTDLARETGSGGLRVGMALTVGAVTGPHPGALLVPQGFEVNGNCTTVYCQGLHRHRFALCQVRAVLV